MKRTSDFIFPIFDFIKSGSTTRHPCHPPEAGFFSPAPDPRSRHGTALLMVLAGLVILSVIAVAFLSTVTTEVALSRNYASKAEATLLAESALNRVIAQIQTATEDPDRVWSSQPGAITTFNQNGSIRRIYKLYSSDNLISDDYDDLLQDVPSDWASQETVYVDLNQPVSSGDRQHYPILDEAALDEVVGFSAVNDDVSMPVQWLYMLEDGSLGPAANGSETNPIIGRVAFWTDDETCKININTAAGDEWDDQINPGSYWSVPTVNTPFDREGLARNQPAKGEFQRYPGHPATTYLSAVFLDLSREQIADILPRIEMESGGASGTKGGTQWATGPLPIQTPPERLFASIDELLFDPDRNPNSPIGATDLERGRFFLTAHSRAPETNLFNKPRVTIWPIDDSPSRRTGFDRLMAFCSTIGDREFFFRRHGAVESYLSPSVDYSGRNVELYQYLQTLTGQPVPGFGDSTFADKYPGLERDQILTQIFDYIRCSNIMDTSVPGVNFTPRYAPSPGETAEGFPQDFAGQVVPIRIGNTKGFGRMTTLSEAALVFYLKYIVPEPDPVTDLNDLPAHVRDSIPLEALPLEPNTSIIGVVLLFEAFNPMEGFAPLKDTFDVTVAFNGFAYIDPDAPPESNLISLNFPNVATNRVRRGAAQNYSGSAKPQGGMQGIAHMLFHPDATEAIDSPQKFLRQEDNENGMASYPFYAQTDMILRPDPTEGTARTAFEFIGGNLDVEISVPDSVRNTVHSIQSFSMTFPDATLATIPDATIPVPDDTYYTLSTSPHKEEFRKFWDFNQRLLMRNIRGTGTNEGRHVNNLLWRGGPGAANRLGDTIISVVPEGPGAQGDIRLVAGLNSVPEAFWLTEPRYFQLGPDSKKAHNLMTGLNRNYLIASLGKLVAGTSTGANHVMMNLSSRIDGVTHAGGGPGDWDTGQGNSADGAFLNKADEGNALYIADPTATGRRPYFHTAWAEYEAVGETFFSPNRQIASPVTFGSLPTGVQRNRPWQTLLFNPKPEDPNHPGRAAPHDHLLLDLFHMPVVEPYAISEPFSTAGKVNLNHRILPFQGITRSTALQAVLRSTRIPAIPRSDYQTYKDSSSTTNYRYNVNLDATMEQISAYLNHPDRPPVFRSASEICEIPLIPDVTTPDTPTNSFSNIVSFWQQNQLTGDNLRERPYAEIYGRLTTKSNTYTVHVRAQSIQKAPDTPASGFVPGQDQITGEYRGSFTIERYLDPNIETYDESEQLGPYHFRVLNVRTFDP